MYLFLIIFLLLYGGMHLYTFFKLRNAFNPRPYLTGFLACWMVIMTAAPLLVRAAEQLEREKAALFIAWPGYLWMGFLFIFTSAMLFTDAVILIYRIILRQLSTIYISPSNTCSIVLLVAILASIYAYMEAGEVRNNHLIITSFKLPPSLSKIRIVQISDMHIGLLSKYGHQKRIMEMIRDAKPDILVSTGDLIDGKLNRDYGISDRNPLAALLASIPTPLGKFAVIGNHEIYAGLPQAVDFSRAAGFTMLRNQSVQPARGMTISGVDDRAINPKYLVNPGHETALLNSASPDSFHLLLKHRPEIIAASDGHFDLQLSGHVHGGQIFPFNFLVRLKHPIPCGTTTTQTGSRIYVSRGAGTWGPPMRLFAPPEITIIDIMRQ